MRRQLNKLGIRLVTGRFPHLAELFVYRKALGLARRGHAVSVLAREPGEHDAFGDFASSGITVELAPPDLSLRTPQRALALATRSLGAVARSRGGVLDLYRDSHRDPRTNDQPLRQFVRHLPFLSCRADVIHFEFLGTGAMYPLAQQLTSTPTVVSCRGSDIHLFDLRPGPVRNAMLNCLRDATAVHCVSNEIAGCVRALVGDRPNIWVNRPAVDSSVIAPRSWPHEPGRKLRIVSVGRLSWHKGFDYLLAALARLRARGIEVDATIIGGGELLAPLRFSCTDLGLDGSVEFSGALAPDDVLAQLQSADVFVLPSHNEGVSNAVLEAMTSGVPVISTAVGGMPEAITDGIEGLLVPVRDVEALGTAIERFAVDRRLCETMGRAARRRAEAEFSLDRQIDQFEAMYDSLREPKR